MLTSGHKNQMFSIDWDGGEFVSPETTSVLRACHCRCTWALAAWWQRPLASSGQHRGGARELPARPGGARVCLSWVSPSPGACALPRCPLSRSQAFKLAQFIPQTLLPAIKGSVVKHYAKNKPPTSLCSQFICIPVNSGTDLTVAVRSGVEKDLRCHLGWSSGTLLAEAHMDALCLGTRSWWSCCTRVTVPPVPWLSPVLFAKNEDCGWWSLLHAWPTNGL